MHNSSNHQLTTIIYNILRYYQIKPKSSIPMDRKSVVVVFK